LGAAVRSRLRLCGYIGKPRGSQSLGRGRLGWRRSTKNLNKTGIIWIVSAFVLAMLWQGLKASRTRPYRRLTDNSADLQTVIPANYPEIYTILRDKDVDIEVVKEGSSLSVLINSLPFLLLLGFWIFMMRQMRSGGMKFGVTK